MLQENNFWLLVLAILPALFYGFIVYINTPFDSIKMRPSVIYTVIGLLSIMFIWVLHWMFPAWGNILDLDWYGYPTILGYFIYAMVQVGFAEELSKATAFYITEYSRNGNVSKDHPIGTMFYCMMTSMGFAVLENFHYAINYGEDVLMLRAVTAIVLHMVCGLIMGYWTALGRFNTKGPWSVLNVWLKHHPKTKKAVYSIAGVVCASIIHGLYDFNLFVEHEYQIPILIATILGGVGTAYLLAKNLIKRTSHLKIQ